MTNKLLLIIIINDFISTNRTMVAEVWLEKEVKPLENTADYQLPIEDENIENGALSKKVQCIILFPI